MKILQMGHATLASYLSRAEEVLEGGENYDGADGARYILDITASWQDERQNMLKLLTGLRGLDELEIGDESLLPPDHPIAMLNTALEELGGAK